MPEFFIHGHTFAAPFVSEDITRYIEADDPGAALAALAAKMHDGIGLYAAEAFASADDFHKQQRPLARWLSNKAEAVSGASTIYSRNADHVEIDGREIRLDDPKAGRLVDA